MSRRRSALLLLAVLGAALGALGCGAGDGVPTYRVARRAFHHQVTAEGLLRAEKATRVTVPSQVESAVRLAWIAPEGTLVEAGDVVARFDPTEMEDRLETGRYDLESAALRVEKTEVESRARVTEIDVDREVADLELEIARRYQKTDQDIYSRHEIIESQLDEQLAGDRLDHAESALERQRAKSRTELDLLAIERRKAQLAIDQAEQGLAALEVRAPHAGLLTLVRDWQGEAPQVGAQMWRGQEIAEIPDRSRMEAEVFVLEADAGGLAVGKPATVVVEADPGRRHPARIRRVEAVAKPRFRGSPVQYFSVVLELDTTDPATMKPGQRVRATLELAEVADALVVPRQAVVQEGGVWRVFVRGEDGFTPRPVEIGASSLGLMVVDSGLAEGEVIALRPPRDAAPAPAPEAPDEGRTASAPGAPAGGGR